jgi:hypothetical protein
MKPGASSIVRGLDLRIQGLLAPCVDRRPWGVWLQELVPGEHEVSGWELEAGMSDCPVPYEFQQGSLGCGKLSGPAGETVWPDRVPAADSAMRLASRAFHAPSICHAGQLIDRSVTTHIPAFDVSSRMCSPSTQMPPHIELQPTHSRAGDREALATLINTHVVWHVPMLGQVRGRDRLISWLGELLIEGCWLTEHDVFGNDEHLCALSVMGMKRGEIDVETRVVSVFHFRDRKQPDRWLYPEDPGAWAQIMPS